MAGLENESTDVISSQTNENTLDLEVGWECGSQYYDLLERVGKGAFAEVFAARCSSGRREGTGVAIKVSNKLFLFFYFFQLSFFLRVWF